MRRKVHRFTFKAAILLLLTAAFFTSAEAEETRGVYVFEFLLENPEKGDKRLKKRIQDKIIRELEKSKRLGKIDKVELVSIASQERLKEDYYKRTGIKYNVCGKLFSLPPETLEIEIILKDLSVEGFEREKAYSRILKKDLQVLDGWSEKVARKIRSEIEGTVVPTEVFLHCFKDLSSQDIIDRIKLMPKRLYEQITESGLGPNCTLASFRTKGDIIDICEKQSGYMDINEYDYIIRGEFEIYRNSNICEVTVELLMIDEMERETLIESFKKKVSPEFFRILAGDIVSEWNGVMTQRDGEH